MPGPHNLITQSLVIVYLVPFPQVKWKELTGGEVTREQAQTYPGGEKTPINVEGGPITVSELTLRTPYDLVRHAPIESWAQGYQAGLEAPLDVIKQPVTSEGVPAGKATTYLNCGLVRLSTPDADAESSEPGMLELALQPERAV